jgi:catechol 2,3-dioxygenase-like lactoylglutathione lyase family enzyme
VPVKLSPLMHLEIVVPDAEKTYQFLHKVFGAEKTQEGFASYLSTLAPGLKCIHVLLGGIVLQLVEPTPDALPSWHKQLAEHGPGVHNLTFLVDDMDEAVKALEEEGAPVIQEIELEWEKVFGPEGARPDLPAVHIVDTSEMLGFRLELAEKP